MAPDGAAFTCEPGVLELEGVTSGSASSVGSFVLTSRVAHPLEVLLKSSVPQLTFQRHNENLADIDDEDDPDDWNELFNEIDLVDRVLLPPHGSEPVIATFRPQECVKDGAADGASKRHNAEGGGTLQTRYAVQEARATVELRPVLPAAAAAAAAATAAAAEPLKLEVVARHCISVLRTDVRELIFDGCTIGASAVRDFTVWNCSEGPLRFKLVLQQKGSLSKRGDTGVQFGNAETGVPVSESGETIPAYSHTRVRVYLKPREAGQFTMELEVRNLNDSRNAETIRVHVVVAAQSKKEGLLISGNGMLDFGDCYTTVAKRELLTLRNVSSVPLDVHLTSDCPAEVFFDLHDAQARDDEEEEEEEEEEDGTDEDERDDGEGGAPSELRAARGGGARGARRGKDGARRRRGSRARDISASERDEDRDEEDEGGGGGGGGRGRRGKGAKGGDDGSRDDDGTLERSCGGGHLD